LNEIKSNSPVGVYSNDAKVTVERREVKKENVKGKKDHFSLGVNNPQHRRQIKKNQNRHTP